MANILVSLLLSSLLLSGPVPRPARLRPPSPHFVHWAQLRRRLPPNSEPCLASEDAPRLPGGVVDQAGAALYGLPPALAVQGLHVGLGHHHLGAGGAHARLVLRLHGSAEESTSKRIAQAVSGHGPSFFGFVDIFSWFEISGNA